MEAQLGDFDRASELFDIGIEHCPRFVRPSCPDGYCRYLKSSPDEHPICHKLLPQPASNTGIKRLPQVYDWLV